MHCGHSQKALKIAYRIMHEHRQSAYEGFRRTYEKSQAKDSTARRTLPSAIGVLGERALAVGMPWLPFISSVDDLNVAYSSCWSAPGKDCLICPLVRFPSKVGLKRIQQTSRDVTNCDRHIILSDAGQAEDFEQWCM